MSPKPYCLLFKFEPSTVTNKNSAERMYDVYYRKDIFSEFEKVGKVTVFPRVSYRFLTLAQISPEQTAYIEKKCRELLHSK